MQVFRLATNVPLRLGQGAFAGKFDNDSAMKTTDYWLHNSYDSWTYRNLPCQQQRCDHFPIPLRLLHSRCGSLHIPIDNLACSLQFQHRPLSYRSDNVPPLDNRLRAHGELHSSTELRLNLGLGRHHPAGDLPEVESRNSFQLPKCCVLVCKRTCGMLSRTIVFEGYTTDKIRECSWYMYASRKQGKWSYCTRCLF